MSRLIEANGLFKHYRLGQARVEVLKGLDMSVEQGEFLAVIGASGSGKSTLLHLLGGLDKADRGQIFYEGRNLESMGLGGLNRYRNQTVGFVFQFYHLLDELNILENVCVPAMARRSLPGWLGASAGVKKRARDLLGRLGLAGRMRHKPYQLSGGERQRVAIARAVINGPNLLLADEPTGNLDSETGNGILEILEEFNRDGQTIIMVTHDDRIAGRAHRIIRLADGRIADNTEQARQ